MDIHSLFSGSGDIELSEETFEVSSGDILTVSVITDEEGAANSGPDSISKSSRQIVDIPIQSIEGQSDWSILQEPDFEVFIYSFLIYLSLLSCLLMNSTIVCE